jgi:hypothetical protein
LRALLLAGCAALGAAGGWLQPAPADAAERDADPAYADELIAHADALRLAGDPQWQALLHYQPRHFSSAVVSAATNDWFFQAPDGKTDPSAELHATLRRFFAADALMKDGEPPQCALRGRYVWLDRRLHFDPRRLPPQPCEQFDEWRRGLDPWGVSLIFPEAFMNNPSSMFGHTLLRIDSGPPGARQDLLAYGVNFSADTGGDGGIPFAYKGILGYYPGRFTVEPYYNIITRYSDWENRDIWEYQLTLDPDAVDLLLAHLWELRGVEFDYYFFDENCSYQILALLDAARPDLRLQQQFRAQVVPADTVRAVVAEPGLVDATAFRPSTQSTLRHAARELPPEQRRLAGAVADGRVAPDDPQLDALSDEARAAVLGTAYDLFRYRYLVDRESTPDEQARARRILLARSRVPVEGPPLSPVPTPAVRPDQGHGSNRAALGTGVRDGQFYLEAQFRPAYHDLMDPIGGYTAGAQIDFFDLTLRYYTKHSDARVHRFTLVDIVSVAPLDAFFHPISWKVGTGMFSRLLPQGHRNDLGEEYVWRSDGGAGLAVEPWDNWLAYMFLDATVDYSPALEEDHAIGGGASTGLFFGPHSDRWKGHLFARVTRFALGDVSTSSSIGLDGRLTLTRQMAIKAGISGVRDFDQNWIEAGVSWNVYF